MEKIFLDSSVLFSLNQANVDALAKSPYEIWDTPVGLFELVNHAVKTEKIIDKNEWVRKRCAFLKQLTGNRMLPSPSLILARELDTFLERTKDDNQCKEEQGLFLGLRNAFAGGQLKTTDATVSTELCEPLRETARHFCESVRMCIQTVYEEVNTKNPEKIEAACSAIQSTPVWIKSCTEALLKSLNASEADIHVLLEKNAVPLYIQNLQGIYCIQLNRIIKNKRPPEESDYIDFEWRAYIASQHMSYFVVNNLRDFQDAFPLSHALSGKLKSYSDLFS